MTTVTPDAKPGKSTSISCTARHGHHRKGHDMPNKIEIRPLDKKETTGDSGGNGGS
ncbi:hypothetical protein OIB37_23630 [Streptomyces sp. NBC_00820]|uniref:hypothetical protein n=1 Tax=Streptomyces sp. NBC_00820 TaxID=2975842 RepID=UPI002ED0486C|nr:hypothetical protein OIB37_23630 [Streptomyces sp. NBC_00820]